MTTTSFASPRRPRSGPAGTRRSRWAGLAFVAPGFVVYALIMLYPAVRAVLISLHDYNIVPGASSPFVGLDNYTRALHDPVLRRSFVNAAFYAAVTVPAQVVIGLFLAVLLDARLPGRTLFRVLFYVPVVTSWVVVSLLFQYLFSTDRGFVNWVLRDFLHVVDHNVNWLGDRWPAMIAICAARHLEGRRLVDGDLPRRAHRRAARAARGRVHRRRRTRRGASVTCRFRSSRGAVATVVILLVIGGFNVFTSVLLMIGNDPLQQKQVPLTYMYDQAFSFLDFGYGSAISFLLTTVVLALAGLQYVVTRRRVRGTFR